VVGIETEFVVGYEMAGNCFTVVGPKQLSRSMPELSGLVEIVSVKFVFYGGVPPS